MSKEKLLQLRIWGWQAINNKWIYVILVILCLLVIPVIGFVSGRRILPDEYHVIYGYVLYIVQTLTFGLGCIPLLMTMHITCQLEVGDCIVLFPEWNQRKQCIISYAFSAVLFFLLMMCLAIDFYKGISLVIVLKDTVGLLVVLWVLVSACSVLAFLSSNVYLTLIIVELYGVLFWNMGIQLDAIWNVFSITGAEGTMWVIRIILYVSLGFLIQEIVGCMQKKLCDKV